MYVSDKPGKHDFALLRKLVAPDGTVLRCAGPGRPTRDCLFHDPTAEDVLLKIFNHNTDAGVVGVFHARHTQDGAEGPSLSGTVGPSDVAGLRGERFAALTHSTGEVSVLAHTETLAVTLPSLGYDVFTFVPIDGGVAPLGFAEMFNSAGAVTEKGWHGAGVYELTVRGAGRLLVWSEQAPARVTAGGADVPFAYDAGTRLLSLNAQAGRVQIVFA